MKWNIAALALLASISAQASECGQVTIADMNWNSAASAEKIAAEL